MFELIRLFPRRPLAVSIAAWTFFFVLQIVFLTFAAYERYVPPPEPRPYERLWFVYTELPRALPMAAVYAVCMVFVAQVIGRFMSTGNPDNLTFGQLREILSKNPTRAATWIGVRLVVLFGIVWLLVDPMVGLPPWVRSATAFLVVLLLVRIVYIPWLDWVVEEVTSGDGRESPGRDAAIDAPAYRSPHRRRRGRRSGNGNTPTQ